jgi:transposase
LAKDRPINLKKLIIKYFKESQIDDISGKKLLKLLTSVPGIGDHTAIQFVSEIGTPKRFSDKKQIIAYCGFDPSLMVSAGKVTSHKPRKGNKELHKTLMRSASVLLNHRTEQFGIWATRIQKKHAKGGYKKACGAIAAKLVNSLYHCWLRKEVFSYDKYKTDFISVDDIFLSDLDLSP